MALKALGLAAALWGASFAVHADSPAHKPPLPREAWFLSIGVSHKFHFGYAALLNTSNDMIQHMYLKMAGENGPLYVMFKDVPPHNSSLLFIEPLNNTMPQNSYDLIDSTCKINNVTTPCTSKLIEMPPLPE